MVVQVGGVVALFSETPDMFFCREPGAIFGFMAPPVALLSSSCTVYFIYTKSI